MQLDLAVTLPGEDEAAEVTIDFDGLDEHDMSRATQLVGVQAMRDLEAERWNALGAAALVYVSLEKQGYDFDFELLDMDLGHLSEFFFEPDREIETSLPMETGGDV